MHVCMHEAAYAPVTAMASEIPHGGSRFRWLTRISILPGESWSDFDKWRKKKIQMLMVFFLLMHRCWGRLVCSHALLLLKPTFLLRSPRVCCLVQTTVPPHQPIPDDINETSLASAFGSRSRCPPPELWLSDQMNGLFNDFPDLTILMREWEIPAEMY